MKLLHASNLLLGKGFPKLPELASALREARLESVRSLLALAQREKVEAILLAGNSLADLRVPHDLLVRFTSLLATSSVPVYVWPGQTDPWQADSPYVLRSDLFQAPVQVFREARLPWSGPLVAVGQELEGAHYTALCQGSPESFDYGQGRGSVFLVEFPGPKVQSVGVGRLNWLERDFQGLNGLREQIQPLVTEDTLLRLRLRGSATLEEWKQFEKWRTSLRMQWLEVDNQLKIGGGKRFHHPLLRALQAKLESVSESAPALTKLEALVARSGKEDLV